MPDLAVHHIQLACPPGGEDEARSFWGDTLGLTEVPRPAALSSRPGCWFRGSGVEIHISAEEGFRPSPTAHPGLVTGSLQALHQVAERVAAAGRTVAWSDDHPDMHRFHTTDPHGNRVELLAPRA